MELNDWEAAVTALLSSPHLVAIRNTTRPGAILTFLGAGYIIQDILKDAARRKATKNRIMLFMSVSDFVNSISILLGTVMAPKGTPGAPRAIGNTSTCTISGFFIKSTFHMSSAYNVSLALCYLLIVKYGYSDERLRKTESFFLWMPIAWSLINSIPGLWFQMYNFSGLWCAIYPAPYGCQFKESPVECERGDNKLLMYGPIFSLSATLVMATIIVTCMVMMFLATLQRERSGDRFRFQLRSSRVRPRRDLSNMMKNQGIWYSGAYLFSFAPFAFVRVFFPLRLDNFTVGWSIAWSLCIFALSAIGLTNAVIYVRPRYIKFRQDHPNVGLVMSIWYTLGRTHPVEVEERNVTPTLWSSIIAFIRSISNCLQSSKKATTRQTTDETASTNINKGEQELKFPVLMKGEENCGEDANEISNSKTEYQEVFQTNDEQKEEI